MSLREAFIEYALMHLIELRREWAVRDGTYGLGD